jgi:hypothetical protein
MLIDKYLPEFDFNERHSITIVSDRQTISSVLENFDFSSSRIIRFLFWLRGMPSKKLSIERLTRDGFIELERTKNDEIVIGLIGQFWKPKGNLQKFEPLEFISFRKPSFLKGVWNFKIGDHADSCLLSTETRVYCTDNLSKRRFSKYWLFVKPFSGLIRMEMLRAIKKASEEKSRAMKREAVIG